MRPYLPANTQRHHPARERATPEQRTNRPAFTMTELVVAVGILAGMMTMVAMIFATATKSSGKAQSITIAHRHLRQVTAAIRSDLESLDPATGILGIAGVTIDARDTPQSALLTHRADVLMLVTQRQFEPYIYQPATTDEFADITHVVYGHANFGKLDPATGAWIAGSERFVESGLTPASQWHLARRVVGFPATGSLTGNGTAAWPLSGNAFSGADAAASNFADVYQDSFATLLPPGTSGLYVYQSNDNLAFYYEENSDVTYRYDSADPTNRYLLKDGYWYYFLTGTNWERREYNPGTGSVEVCPECPQTAEPAPDPTLYSTSNSTSNWREWFYTGLASRVWLDTSPPAGMSNRLASYFLPACSEFKVEFTYDDPREIDIDSGTHEPILFDWDGDGNNDTPAPRPINWYSVPVGQTQVWSKLSAGYPSIYSADGDLRNLTHPYRWPRGVRITIRVYDQRGGLEAPLEQTIIHTWETGG